MPVEAELTALVRDPHLVRTTLGGLAPVERSTYADTYYDRPDHSLDAAGYELRVRTVTTADRTRTVLTYKQPSVHGTGSKPEHETTVADPDVLRETFLGLGLTVLTEFRKHCDNYRFTRDGRDVLATVVEVPELPGQTFLEVETVAEPDEVEAALGVVRSVLAELGVVESDFSTVPYTDRVAAQRAGRGLEAS
ncbi:adenylate cyclase, class 2 [Prauserella aidingensis]|uniref:class IV adenylate cyclase n=1 Tax=Prauserella aidingensis TaxID=387890 RepID=UPI0027E2678F|nr:class IV adenylate cyclase [Prauserella aidingensis]MCP2255925.1 adenylate cyclase, class 2 [Prauserella aidingensis]